MPTCAARVKPDKLQNKHVHIRIVYTGRPPPPHPTPRTLAGFGVDPPRCDAGSLSRARVRVRACVRVGAGALHVPMTVPGLSSLQPANIITQGTL